MKGIIGKIFGRDPSSKAEDSVIDLLGGALDVIIEKADFDLSFDIEEVAENDLTIDFYGEDDTLLTERGGQLLEAFQLYLKRIVQHKFSDRYVNIIIDCNGFREKSEQLLINLAEKLKQKAIDKGGPVYAKALPPHDRKVIHQFLAEDEEVKSCSIGNGLYKKIKIYPQIDGGNRKEE